MSALRRVPPWVAAALTVAPRDHDMERSVAPGVIAGAVVASLVGAGAGAVVDKVSK